MVRYGIAGQRAMPLLVDGGPRDRSQDRSGQCDDDIVARQLREAAMKEKDPQLRERLWQEYRDYKKGVE